ncbi:MAG: hypothetical protein KGJ86_08375 [Chloroflexota bacterium]|nr:hypothetical protein [Chloroflexota bacterium]
MSIRLTSRFRRTSTGASAGLALILAAGIALSGCGGAAAASSSGGVGPASTQGGGAAASGQSAAEPTQTNEGGQVTIAVTWPGPAAGPVFNVAMNTHSVDLDGVDLRQSAVLVVDNGPEIQPTAWDAPKGGHHRQGTLTFPASTSNGGKTVGPSNRTVELVIRNLAGVPERVFKWSV